MLILPWLVPGIQSSFNSLKKARPVLDRVSPTLWSLDADFNLHESEDPNRQELHNMGLKIFPLVVNEGFKGEVAGKLLETKSSRKQTAQILTAKIVEGNYPGINMDFEGPFGDYRNEYSEFIALLADMLHEHGKEISVDVIALNADPTPAHTWGYPFDYRALAPVIDYLVLMGYDYSHAGSPPGPVSPNFWLKEVKQYTTSIVPAKKVIMGLPLYGRYWTTGPDNVHSQGRGVTYNQAMDFATKWREVPRLDEAGCLHLKVEFADGSVEQIYFEDKNTLLKKIKIAEGLAGIAFWRLGQEDDSIWDCL